MVVKASVKFGRILPGITIVVAVYTTTVVLPVRSDVLEFHLAEALKL